MMAAPNFCKRPRAIARSFVLNGKAEESENPARKNHAAAPTV